MWEGLRRGVLLLLLCTSSLSSASFVDDLVTPVFSYLTSAPSPAPGPAPAELVPSSAPAAAPAVQPLPPGALGRLTKPGFTSDVYTFYHVVRSSASELKAISVWYA